VRLVAASLIAIALFGSDAAYAQRAIERDTGSNIPVPKRARIPESGSKAERGNVVMREFARCTIDRMPGKVATLLAMPLGREYDKAMRQVVSEECLSAGEISFKPILLRGALFTELWQRRMLAESKGKTWGPVLPAYDLSAPIADAGAETKQQQGLLWFADCIVKRDRPAANDVIVRQVGSSAQDEAYARLMPDLGPCLPQGQQVKFSKPILEGVLAEALYRAPAATSTEAGIQ
jgi:hypothetical protein